MLRYFFYLLVTTGIIGGTYSIYHLYRVSSDNKKEMAQYEGLPDTVNNNLGKTLVIFYSLTGHTKNIAQKIKDKTNADIFEIQTAQELPKGPMLHLSVRKQIKNKEYPELKDIPDISSYDLIFIGSPVWWYTAATPVLSLLNKVDFKGKKVVPFSTQGSNAGTFFKDFQNHAQNATILTYASFNNMGKEYDQAIDAKIAAWINSL